VLGRCGLKLPLVSDYGKGYAFRSTPAYSDIPCQHW
jgi:hypothetical protein